MIVIVNHNIIKMNNKKQIFSKRLKTARTMAGLSQDKLVKALDNAVSKNSIWKYENGKMLPSSQTLILLSKALDVKIDYFFRPIKYKESSFDFCYRKIKSKLKKTDQERIENYVLDSYERYSELEQLLDKKFGFSNPLGVNRLVNNIEDIEKKVKIIRDKWLLGTDPVTNLIDLLEDEGIKVFALNEIEAFDGISCRINGDLVIAINENMPADRKRFNILHELAHLILEFDKNIIEKEQEKLCHKFASSFLMTKKVFVREFGLNRRKLTLQELKYLKEYFGASIQAIVYRANDLKLVSDSFLKDFFIRWNRLGYKKNEPGKYMINERPTRFNQLLLRAAAENYISFSKAAYLADKRIDEFESKLTVV